MASLNSQPFWTTGKKIAVISALGFAGVAACGFYILKMVRSVFGNPVDQGTLAIFNGEKWSD